jgi:hypothetical protein
MRPDHDNELDQSTGEPDRRRFLTRNVLAIGAIAATGLTLTKTTPASANCGNSKPVGRGCSKCLLAGTVIRTVEGDRKVEDIVAGDLVPTLFGGARPVRWVGRYVYKKSDAAKPWNRDVRPIRIARSALAPNIPTRDLFVTSWHCLYIDGLLVPAGNLVNWKTIAPYSADEFDELRYFHIKLAGHDVIYAEGAPCETLLNVDEGANNFAEYYRLYGKAETEEAPCAPLVYYNGRRGQIASRIRSAMSPWLDRRTRLDVIRDRLEERGVALAEGLA